MDGLTSYRLVCSLLFFPLTTHHGQCSHSGPSHGGVVLVSEEFTLMYSTLQLTDTSVVWNLLFMSVTRSYPYEPIISSLGVGFSTPPAPSPTLLPASEEAPVSPNMPTVCAESEGQLVCLLLRQQAWLQLSSLGMWCEWAQGLPQFWNDLDPIQWENIQKRQLCQICHRQYWEAVLVWLGKRGAAGNQPTCKGLEALWWTTEPCVLRTC